MKADFSKIEYLSDSERDKFALRNRAFCEALNGGSRFAILFVQNLFGSGQEETVSNEDLYYALVVLTDGRVMPFSLFEEAFSLPEGESICDLLSEEKTAPWRDHVTSVETFVNWLRKHCGDQFAFYEDGYPALAPASAEKRNAIAEVAARL